MHLNTSAAILVHPTELSCRAAPTLHRTHTRIRHQLCAAFVVRAHENSPPTEPQLPRNSSSVLCFPSRTVLPVFFFCCQLLCGSAYATPTGSSPFALHVEKRWRRQSRRCRCVTLHMNHMCRNKKDEEHCGVMWPVCMITQKRAQHFETKWSELPQTEMCCPWRLCSFSGFGNLIQRARRSSLFTFCFEDKSMKETD